MQIVKRGEINAYKRPVGAARGSGSGGAAEGLTLGGGGVSGAPAVGSGYGSGFSGARAKDFVPPVALPYRSLFVVALVDGRVPTAPVT